jgi:hypothetical protein
MDRQMDHGGSDGQGPNETQPRSQKTQTAEAGAFAGIFGIFQPAD